MAFTREQLEALSDSELEALVKAKRASKSSKPSLSKQEEEAGYIESTARALAQGATAGFSDEATAGLEAAYRSAVEGQDFGGAYEQAVAESRAAYQKAANDNPTISFLAETAGSIASPVSKVLKGSAAIKAAKEGALYALGKSDESITDLSPDTAYEVATGAVLGGGLTKAGQKLASKLKKADPTKVADEMLYSGSGPTKTDNLSLKEKHGKDYKDVVGSAIREASEYVGEGLPKTVDESASYLQKFNDELSNRLQSYYNGVSSVVGNGKYYDKDEIVKRLKKTMGGTNPLGTERKFLASEIDSVVEGYGKGLSIEEMWSAAKQLSSDAYNAATNPKASNATGFAEAKALAADTFRNILKEEAEKLDPSLGAAIQDVNKTISKNIDALRISNNTAARPNNLGFKDLIGFGLATAAAGNNVLGGAAYMGTKAAYDKFGAFAAAKAAREGTKALKKVAEKSDPKYYRPLYTVLPNGGQE